MKRKLLIPLMVALVLVLVPSSTVLAGEYFDIEDPCVADNEDFSQGFSFSKKGKVENHFGAQPQPASDDPADDYNLYRDDATGSGKYNNAWVNTLTPERIDLPISLPFGDYWLEFDPAASDTIYYWAKKPRGYDLPSPPAPSEAYNRYKGLSGVFWVEVLNFSGFDTFKWDEWGSFDRVLAEDVVAYNRVNGLICTLYIPEGTHLSFPGRPYTLVTNLFVEKDDDGGIYFEPGNMDFSQECGLKLAYADGTVEVITFTQIRGGLPVRGRAE